MFKMFAMFQTTAVPNQQKCHKDSLYYKSLSVCRRAYRWRTSRVAPCQRHLDTDRLLVHSSVWCRDGKTGCVEQQCAHCGLRCPDQGKHPYSCQFVPISRTTQSLMFCRNLSHSPGSWWSEGFEIVSDRQLSFLVTIECILNELWHNKGVWLGLAIIKKWNFWRNNTMS